MPDRPQYPPRPAQPPGPTVLQYSPDGSRLNVAGCGNFARSYRTNYNGEPDMVVDTHEDTLAVASGDDFVVLGCEDGTVTEYRVPSGEIERMIVRFTLPVRDLALLKGGDWVAAASDEVEVKLVNRSNIEETMTLSEHPKPIKHLTVSPDGKYLAASCTNGVIYVYDVSSLPERPTLYRSVDGVARSLETSDVASSEAVWHPDGRAFACATSAREIQVVSISDGAFQRSFKGGHAGDITALAWSSNGALLASAATDDHLLIWNSKTQNVLRKQNYEKILHIQFHPGSENILNWTNSWGECSIQPSFFQDDHSALLKGPKVRAPFFHDPLDSKLTTNGINGHAHKRRAGTPDSLDELLGDDPEDNGADLDDWIEDDDNAGYTNGVNGNGKRTNGHLDLPVSKRGRYSSFSPEVHPAFQPSQTPWRGNRRYLALNLLGFVWSVDHDTHRTVTVEFFDREEYRDFHFTDYFGYDKSCLTEHGSLYASAAKDGNGGIIFYRPHETWVTRSDGGNGSRLQLSDGEEATSIALGKRYIIATTNFGYVRVWTLFGTPVRVWRVKNGPAVSCAAWGDFVLTVGNGPIGSDGRSKLVYSIEDLRNDETLQSEDVVALSDSEDAEEWGLQSLFWSDEGDPCIYDKSGVLLTLLHWRTPSQAKWTPLLDTRRLERLRDGKKEETYWPVAVAGERFHCVILKGGETSPYFPRPLLSEFEFEIPVGRIIEDESGAMNEDGEPVSESNAKAGARLEESFVRRTLLLEMLRDAVDAQGEHASHTLKTELARREIEVDKVLLQLLAVECREGEDRGMKALEVVKLMRDRSGRMLEAAGKVAQRWGFGVLEEKVREVAERRVGGLEEV